MRLHNELAIFFRAFFPAHHSVGALWSSLCLPQECRRRGIDYIVAPYEADAQLAYLAKNKMADIVVTEDSDLILFGCDKVSHYGKLAY